MPFKNKRQIKACFAAHDPKWNCEKWLKVTPKNIPESLSFKQWLEGKHLTEATKEDFWELGNLQRDRPEHAMLQVQYAMGGGVMNPVIEHVGDLIHRMTERPTWSYAGYEYVKNKVEKTLRWLTNGYGFAKEFSENIANNASSMGIPAEQLRSKIYRAMDVYADEHAKLPTYNRAQKLAQIAAVSLGRRQFHKTVQALKMLQSHLGSMQEWINFAHQGVTQNEPVVAPLP